ncbi:MAG: potassium channel protein [Turneriella sp.]|nr:potassium channel protein [Turneriella sp.]
MQRLRIVWRYAKLFVLPATLLAILLIAGASGYTLIEDYPLFDAIYMTVISITTVGFSEIRPLSQAGRLFTIFLILGGVIFYGLGIHAIVQVIFRHSFRSFMREELTKEKIRSLKNHYIVCGGGRMAYAICTELARAGKDFVVVEKNPESVVARLVAEEKVPWLLVAEDALREDVLRDMNVGKARALFSVLPTDADNLFVVLTARSLNPQLWIETRIEQESSRSKMLLAGANRVLSPYHVAGIQMARSALKPQLDDVVEVFYGVRNYEFELKVRTITPESEYAGKKLGECRLGEQGFCVVALEKPDGSILYAPPADILLEPGTSVFFLGKSNDARHQPA